MQSNTDTYRREALSIAHFPDSSETEVEPMAQSMAEVLIERGMERGMERGIEQGARQTSIESTLAILTERFPTADTTEVRSVLEAIGDLDRLKRLTLQAFIAPSFRAFQEHLDA